MRTRFRLPAMLLLSLALASTGCSSLKSVFKRDGDASALEGVAVEQLYQKGHQSMRNGNWDTAVLNFRRLIAQYPYGPYTEQAMIEMAYAQYKAGANEDAVSTIDRFLRTYTTHRNTPYMYYLRGLVNSDRDTVFLQRIWALDASRRDLATPKQGYSDFNTVVEHFPNSRYAEDARKRMRELNDLFARHEIDTALYYLRRQAWPAAALRARTMLETYPDSQYASDAVAAMAEAYTRLGNTALADDARARLVQMQPNHPWLQGRNWPHYPWMVRRLNPFAGEKSPLDNDRHRQ